MMKLVGWIIGSTPGRIILGVIAFLVWLQWHDAKVADRARSECQAETLRRTLQEVQRQKEAAEALLEEARERAEVSQREVDLLEREKDAINEEMAKAGNQCEPVSDAILERLRNIR